VSVTGCKDCAVREAKILAQEARFDKACADFKLQAERIQAENRQKGRVIDQMRAQLREATDENYREALQQVEGRDEEMNALKDEAQKLRGELATVRAELEKLKGTPAELDRDPEDPEGTRARVAGLEID
jgi:predicted  nucleic acid-binding Zn-ribbon protein